MALRNTTETYGSMAKTLHWLVSLMVTSLLLVGFFMGDLAKPFRFTVYNIHKLVGLSLLLIMIFRVGWTLSNPRLNYPVKLPYWQIRAARGVHMLLYLLVIAMPLSGWIMATAAEHPPDLFGFKFILPFIPASKPLAKSANQIHKTMAWTLIAVLSLHIGAALKHYFVNKDNVLQRMLPFTRS